MYLYYLLGWKVGSKYYRKLEEGADKKELRREFQVS